MKILVIGGGGREHNIGVETGQSTGVEKIWCAPGNGGITEEAECVAVDAGDVAGLVALAEKVKPDLTVVGPELPLVNGLVDAFTHRNWAVVGRTKRQLNWKAARSSRKNFCKDTIFRQRNCTVRTIRREARMGRCAPSIGRW